MADLSPMQQALERWYAARRERDDQERVVERTLTRYLECYRSQSPAGRAQLTTLVEQALERLRWHLHNEYERKALAGVHAALYAADAATCDACREALL